MTCQAQTFGQGDLRLLQTEPVRRLLQADQPARFAYIAPDGTPRVVPTWFHWNGAELVMPTFISAPHVTRPSLRLAALARNPHVAVTIDTNSFPPEALNIRGRAEVTEVDGIPDEYASAAVRYLGRSAADTYLSDIDQPETRMARISVMPRWVGFIDFHNRMPAALGGITAHIDSGAGQDV